MKTEILKPIHTSPETAYVVEDYPYGFRLRCKIRYWLEYSKTHGYRFVSQTTNPKRAGEHWNAPKKSTYVDLAAVLYINEDGHLKWSGLHKGSKSETIKAWLEECREGLTQEAIENCEKYTELSRLVEEKFASGE